ncbi:Uncharacterised protein [Vibrio cholerae]|nr:Uncharacterised protein [Vibrio cholerae]CSI39000.1 Uncharacterised protein [Vibrio cholerae]
MKLHLNAYSPDLTVNSSLQHGLSLGVRVHNLQFFYAS